MTTVHFLFHLHIQRTPLFFSRQRSHHFLHGANDRGAALLPIPNRFGGENVAFGVQINQQIRSSRPLRKVGAGHEPWRSGVSAERRSSGQQPASGALPRRRYGETVQGQGGRRSDLSMSGGARAKRQKAEDW